MAAFPPKKRVSHKLIAALVLAGLAGPAFCLAFVLQGAEHGSQARLATNASATHRPQQADARKTAPQAPRLKIPKIQVDAAIDPMGVTRDGAMQAPDGGKNVGWFKLGPLPGNKGSAVIAGHFGRWKDGETSVFDDLNQLKKGDVLYVEDGKGPAIEFIVSHSRVYDPLADATEVFTSPDAKAHLNLITCQGPWDESAQSYTDRLVVFADKLE